MDSETPGQASSGLPDECPTPSADDAVPPERAGTLRDSEEQFRRAIEEAPIPVIMHAEDGEVLQISRSWTELTGYTLADVPTLDAWLNHAYGEGAETVRSHVHNLFVGDRRTLNVTFDIRARTGELRHWSFSASSPGTLRDGRRFVVGMAVDITERARTERALAEQARLLDLSNDAIIVRDVNNRILYWNHGATELYGWTREEAVGQDLHTLLRTEFEIPFDELIARLQEQDRMEGEVVQVTRDGRRLTLFCRWALDRDTAGQPGAILTTTNDITARKQMEEALREREEGFRTVTNVVPQLIWTNDADGNANYFNERWYAYSGLSFEQSAGVGWQAMVHPDDAPASVELWQRALATGELFETEYRLRRADGAYRWHLGRNVPLRDASGQLTGWFGSATDIEALKQAEAARRESEERFRLLVEGARDYAMFLLDPEDSITFWSLGAERVFGWSEAEALGQNGALIFTEEDRTAGVPAQERATARREGSALDRRWHVRKDGSVLFVDGSLTRLNDEQGGLRGFVKVGRDATVQRKAEEAIERANAELEQRVQERTAALSASNQAREKLLRQLVTAQEEERLRIARDLHDQLGQQITGLLLGLKQLEALAQDMPLAAMLPPLEALAVEMAKESHRLAVNLRPTALDDVGFIPALEQLVADWSRQTQIPSAFHSGELKGDRLPLVLETTVYRVVQEALTNVYKYAQARSVSVLLERRDGEVVVIVEDVGRGFDSDAALPEGERPRLGLRGMRERVAQVNGTLEIETSLGKGTTLFIRIPLET